MTLHSTARFFQENLERNKGEYKTKDFTNASIGGTDSRLPLMKDCGRHL